MTTDVDNSTRHAARQSETGQRLTGSQFDEAWQVAGIIHREIRKSTSFISKLTDYAHAFARDQRFDAARGEMILRDLYKDRFGETMNQTREALLERQANVRDESQDIALEHSLATISSVRLNDDIPFWQALDRSAVTFGNEQDISEVFAKSLIKDAFEAEFGSDFYKAGKEAEKIHDQPEKTSERAKMRAQQPFKRRTSARTRPDR